MSQLPLPAVLPYCSAAIANSLAIQYYSTDKHCSNCHCQLCCHITQRQLPIALQHYSLALFQRQQPAVLPYCPAVIARSITVLKLSIVPAAIASCVASHTSCRKCEATGTFKDHPQHSLVFSYKGKFLKGQCHEIFDPYYVCFKHSTGYPPLWPG